ncbi:MAG TPA: 50S ribosomal protein L11 methyltransferase [Desulfobacterales bacterium]
MQKLFRKWIEVRVELGWNPSDAESVLQQLADVFHGFDLGGVVIDDPQDQPEEGWGGDVRPVSKPAVSAYLLQNPELENQLSRLRQKFEGLKVALGGPLQMVLREVDEEDWAESWKRFFKPIRICEKVLVKPSWEEVNAAAGDLVIDIDPGMAFGTGDHPTTRLCIELIQQYMVAGTRFLDVGTGSGILAIAAAGLGAAEVWAVDRDAAAVAIAAQNLQRNGVDSSRYRLVQGHLLQALLGPYELVAANILSEVILELAADLPRVLSPGGVFIASGINTANGRRVASHLKSAGFTILQDCRREEWVALVCRWENRGAKVR